MTTLAVREQKWSGVRPCQLSAPQYLLRAMGLEEYARVITRYNVVPLRRVHVLREHEELGYAFFAKGWEPWWPKVEGGHT